MVACQIDFEIPQGDSQALLFRLTLAGAPVDVSNAQLLFTIKRDIADPDEEALVTRDVALGSDESTAAGEAGLILSSDDTAIPPGTYYYGARIVFADGGTKTLSGRNRMLRVTLPVTRRTVPL